MIVDLYYEKVAINHFDFWYVSIFEVTDIYFKLSVDENGKLKDADENVWDITNIDEVIK